MINESTAASSIAIGGNFDCVLEGQAHGWAFLPANLQKRLDIEIVLGSEVVARGKANLLRDDVKEAGIGDGFYGFILPLSCELFNGKAHQLIAREMHTRTVLSGSPVTMEPVLHENNYVNIERGLGLALLAELFSSAPYQALSANAANFHEAYRLASLLQETGCYSDAINAWVTINNALGDNYLCYCKIGECALLEGQPNVALAAFEQAAACDNKKAFPYQGMAQAYQLMDKFDEAEDALKIAVDLSPENTQLNKLLLQLQRDTLPQRINSLIENGQRGEAIQWLVSILLAEPENKQAYELLGELLCSTTNKSSHVNKHISELRKSERVLSVLLDAVESQVCEVSL